MGDITAVANYLLYGCISGQSSSAHEYVDLGLPSGTLWATCNVGAEAPEDFGDFYAWGETKPKSTYTWATYKYCKGSETSMTKYCTNDNYGTVDYKTVLDLTDDAAFVNWGRDWRMPTLEEEKELYSQCTCTYFKTGNSVYNGVPGYQFTGSNGNSIFLPCAGEMSDTGHTHSNVYGNYWSSTLDADQSKFSWYIFYMTGKPNTYSNNRYYGHSVRPVRSKAN